MNRYTYIWRDWLVVQRIFAEATHVNHAGPIFIEYWADQQIH